MSNNSSEDTKDFYTIERGKSSNTTSTRNVLFATGVEKSSSLYMIDGQLPTTLINSNSITTTSQFIKQSLSPLIQQNITNSLNDSNTNTITNQHKTKLNSVSLSSGDYQFSSNTFITNSNKTKPFDVSYTSNEKTSSPSRSLINNHTNTLPSYVGRSNNVQFQFESNCLLQNKQKNVASPEKTLFFNTLNSISSSNASVTTLSQTSLSVSTSVSNTIFSKPTNSLSNTTVSAVANEFEQLIARNASNSNSVKYSSTNPFLNNFNSTDSEIKATDGQ